MNDVEAFETEYRARVAAAQTDSDRLAIATELLQEAVAQSARSMALATEARANSMHALEAGERLAVETKRIIKALSGSVAFIVDGEEVLHSNCDVDPHKLLTLLLRAIEECRSMILAETLASRTVQ